jgi:hypothetical protein
MGILKWPCIVMASVIAIRIFILLVELAMSLGVTYLLSF